MKKLTRRDFLKGARDLGISVGLLPLARRISELPLETIEEEEVVNEAVEDLLYGFHGFSTAQSIYLGASPKWYEKGTEMWSCKHCGYVGSVGHGSCPSCGSNEKEKFVVP